MAARLSLDERVFIESSLGAGRSVADVAQRLGRDRSTVHRELARCAGRAGYDARWAHAWACARARRERTPKLAADRVLAAAVDERLKLGPGPRTRPRRDLREAGMSVCAETIYRACYANDARSGLAAGTWAKLPRRARRRRPRSVAQAQKPSPLREYRPTADRPDDVEDRMEPGHCERDLIVGKANLTAAVTLAERTSRYTVTAALPDGYGAPQAAAADAAALGRQPAAARAHPHLGPRPRDGPLGRHRSMRSASRCSSASRARRGSDPPTSTPTDCCADGSPKAPASTSDNCGSRSSRTTSTTCPADSTTGNQPPTSTLNSLATCRQGLPTIMQCCKCQRS